MTHMFFRHCIRKPVYTEKNNWELTQDRFEYPGDADVESQEPNRKPEISGADIKMPRAPQKPTIRLEQHQKVASQHQRRSMTLSP